METRGIIGEIDALALQTARMAVIELKLADTSRRFAEAQRLAGEAAHAGGIVLPRETAQGEVK